MPRVSTEDTIAVGRALADCPLPLLCVRAAGTVKAAPIVNRTYEDLEFAVHMARQLAPEASRFELVAAEDDAARPPGGVILAEPVFVVAEFTILPDE